MVNRFVEMDAYLKQVSGKKSRRRQAAPTLGYQSSWAQPFAAADRALVILIENGGIDLGIPELVDKIISAVPGASNVISDETKKKLVNTIREKLKSFTDNLLESAELVLNRYAAAKPDLFGDVVVLRAGTASYQDLKRTLIALAQGGKIVDLFILTH